jgi:hypothetical protein
MLVHFFWLLEFKFKFEFYLLNPFQTQNQIPKPFFLLPYPCYLLTQPASFPARSTPREQQPNPPSSHAGRAARLAQQPSAARGPAGLPAQATAGPRSRALSR